MEETLIYIVWDKKFEIGIPAIDRQHKKLVEMCNELYIGLLRHRMNSLSMIDESLRKTLHAAVDYVREHFSTEEKLMKICNYPDYEEHKKRHEVFIAKILETAKQFETSPLSLSFQLVKFIYDWILEHISYEDTLYVKYVLEYAKKVKEVQTVA